MHKLVPPPSTPTRKAAKNPSSLCPAAPSCSCCPHANTSWGASAQAHAAPCPSPPHPKLINPPSQMQHQLQSRLSVHPNRKKETYSKCTKTWDYSPKLICIASSFMHSCCSWWEMLCLSFRKIKTGEAKETFPASSLLCEPLTVTRHKLLWGGLCSLQQSNVGQSKLKGYF